MIRSKILFAVGAILLLSASSCFRLPISSANRADTTTILDVILTAENGNAIVNLP